MSKKKAHTLLLWDSTRGYVQNPHVFITFITLFLWESRRGYVKKPHTFTLSYFVALEIKREAMLKNHILSYFYYFGSLTEAVSKKTTYFHTFVTF